MASSRLSLNGPDTLDVGVIMRAFEEINQVTLYLVAKVAELGAVGCLDWELSAFPKGANPTVATPYSSQRFRTGLYPNQTMESVIMLALYAIDDALARHEMTAPQETA